MDIVDFMKCFADEIGGHFSAYDNKQYIIVVPLGHNRYQSVLGSIKEAKKFDNKPIIEFTSKVCAFSEDIDLAELLQQHIQYNHCKFILSDNFIKVEATVVLNQVTSTLLKEMIFEVAHVADTWEYKTTGLDVY